MKPVVAIYSTFLQRGYDQLIHDVALQNLLIKFAIDRVGIVGADGATHGAFDIAPALSSQHDGDGARGRERMPADAHTAFKLDTPAAVRYPRGSGPASRLPRP
jgi:1-deoxy-D-xylulose-5-phosphate synthase